MRNIINSHLDLIKNKLDRRGYDLKNSKALIQGQKGSLIYLKKKISGVE